MKSILILILVLATTSCFAQKETIPPTESFTIQGKVKKSLSISLADLSSYKSHTIDSIVITNHLHERRGVLQRVKGVSIRDILDKVEIDAENPKVLSEYYLVFIASDNYKVVFSWNELFNSDAGQSVFVLTGHDGKPASPLTDRIALISQGDKATGRRYVKGLQKIIIERAQ